MDSDKFKIGVFLDGTELPAWQADSLKELADSSYASLSVAVIRDRAETAVRADRRDSIVHRLIQGQARKRSDPSTDACLNRDISWALKQVRIIRLTQPSPTALQRTADVFESISMERLDLFLAYADSSPLDLLSPLARFGVWRFQHDNLPPEWANSGYGAGVWEVLERHPVIRSVLLIRRAPQAPDSIAYESTSAVHHTSLTRTRNEHFSKMAFFVPRALKRLRALGENEFFAELATGQRAHQNCDVVRQRRLTNRNLIRPLIAYFMWRLRLKLQRKRFGERWILLYKLEDDSLPLPIQPATFSRILPPKGRFWADPYVIRRDGRYCIFFEDASTTTGHGHISGMEMGEGGHCTDPRPVIERPYHLSYPYLFEWNGNLFLIPESADNGTIEVYRCVKFPYEWKFHQLLMSGISAYDSTLLEYQGLWWLFANVKAHPASSSWDELCLFYADTPLSTAWRPHPMNPVVTDVRRARPAGRIFVERGELYRPSQDSSYRYGYGLNINRILELTPKRYREELTQVVQPNWDDSILAVHTLTRAEKLTMLDAIHRHRRAP